MVNVATMCANVDPEVFTDPLELDIRRERNRHGSFATGWHRCLGSHLARLDLRIALEVFHRRIPDYEIAPGAALTYLHSHATRSPVSLPLVWGS